MRQVSLLDLQCLKQKINSAVQILLRHPVFTFRFADNKLNQNSNNAGILIYRVEAVYDPPSPPPSSLSHDPNQHRSGVHHIHTKILSVVTKTLSLTQFIREQD